MPFNCAANGHRPVDTAGQSAGSSAGAAECVFGTDGVDYSSMVDDLVGYLVSNILQGCMALRRHVTCQQS